MPAGLGATWIKELVRICHAGVCALVFGISVTEADTAKIATIKIVIALLFRFCIFIFLNKICIEQEAELAPCLTKHHSCFQPVYKMMQITLRKKEGKSFNSIAAP